MTTLELPQREMFAISPWSMTFAPSAELRAVRDVSPM